MKKWKKALALVLSSALIFSLAACGSSESDSAEETEDVEESETVEEAEPAEESEAVEESGGSIAVTVPSVQSTFCNDFALGTQAAAEDLGWDCTINDPNVDLETQITAIENFVTSGVKGIVVFPVDGNGVSDACQAAMDAGVVITANDANCAADLRVEEDEIATGHTLAQPGIDWVNENTDGAVQIAILAPNEAEDSHNGRILTGLMEAIEEELPDSEIVSVQKSTDSSETMTLIENVIQAYPDVQLFYNQLDDTIAYEALNSLGYNRDDVCLIGAGGDDDTYKLIAEGGVLRATITTDIYDIGYQCGLATIAQATGETPESISTNYTIVDFSNIDDFYTAE